MINEELTFYKPDGWRGNRIKERQVKNLVKKHIDDDKKAVELLEIIKNQGEY